MKAAGLNMAEWKNYNVYEPKGCEKCNGIGFKGRLAIHEALYFTKELRQIIVKSGKMLMKKKIRIQAKKDGSLNLRKQVWKK